jgi:hypothetical protein
MSGTSGFSNQKKLGKSEFVTVHSAGSDRKGLATSQLYLADVNAVAVAISAVTQSNDKKITYVDLGTAHDARLGDVLRMTTGTLIQWEFEIIEIPSANIVGIFNIAPTLPLATEEVKVCRWVTAKSDDQGALQVSQGPLQYTRNGAVQEVIEDTAVAANNRPLPAGLYIIKDGVAKRPSLPPSRAIWKTAPARGSSPPSTLFRTAPALLLPTPPSRSPSSREQAPLSSRPSGPSLAL